MYLIGCGKTRLDAFAFAIRHRHCQAISRGSCRSVAAAPSPVTKDSFSRHEQTLWDIHTINAPDTAHRECNLRCESKINLEYGGAVTLNSRLEEDT